MIALAPSSSVPIKRSSDCKFRLAPRKGWIPAIEAGEAAAEADAHRIIIFSVEGKGPETTMASAESPSPSSETSDRVPGTKGGSTSTTTPSANAFPPFSSCSRSKWSRLLRQRGTGNSTCVCVNGAYVSWGHVIEQHQIVIRAHNVGPTGWHCRQSGLEVQDDDANLFARDRRREWRLDEGNLSVMLCNPRFDFRRGSREIQCNGIWIIANLHAQSCSCLPEAIAGILGRRLLVFQILLSSRIHDRGTKSDLSIRNKRNRLCRLY